MRRTVILPAAFSLVLLLSTGANAVRVSGDGTPESYYVQELDYRIRLVSAFLQTVHGLIDKDNNQDAAPYLRLADSAAEKSLKHFKAGEYEFAEEDVSEASRMAVYAVIIAKGADPSMRDLVIKEEILYGESQENERKEAQIKRWMADVEFFIFTAEKLLRESGSEVARAYVNEAKELLMSSKKDVALRRFDSSLVNVKKSYELATKAIRDLKSGQPISFPKPRTEDEKELYAYELQRNDTYIFFASQSVKPGSPEGALLKDGQTRRVEAEDAANAGDLSTANRKLRESTELLMRAIRTAAGE